MTVSYTVALQLLVLFLAFFHLLLRLLIIKNEKAEIGEDGSKVNLWGKLVIALIAIPISSFIIMTNNLESQVMKWFFVLLVIVALGFQSFIDWKYLKGSKRFVVSIVVGIIGVVLVIFLL